MNLDVDVGHIVEGERLALSSVKRSFGLDKSLFEALSFLLIALGSLLAVKVSEELVVLGVGGELEWVLVVSEKSVVTIGKVSKSTALK